MFRRSYILAATLEGALGNSKDQEADPMFHENRGLRTASLMFRVLMASPKQGIHSGHGGLGEGKHDEYKRFISSSRFLQNPTL